MQQIRDGVRLQPSSARMPLRGPVADSMAELMSRRRDRRDRREQERREREEERRQRGAISSWCEELALRIERRRNSLIPRPDPTDFDVSEPRRPDVTTHDIFAVRKADQQAELNAMLSRRGVEPGCGRRGWTAPDPEVAYDRSALLESIREGTDLTLRAPGDDVMTTLTKSATFGATPVSTMPEPPALAAASDSASGNLAQEVQTLRDQQTCIVCMDQPRGTVFVPCGHLAVCTSCAASHCTVGTPCPVCKTDIATVVKTYVA